MLQIYNTTDTLTNMEKCLIKADRVHVCLFLLSLLFTRAHKGDKLLASFSNILSFCNIFVLYLWTKMILEATICLLV